MTDRIVFTFDEIYKIRRRLEQENKSDEFIAGYIEGITDGYNAMNELISEVINRVRNSD